MKGGGGGVVLEHKSRTSQEFLIYKSFDNERSLEVLGLHGHRFCVGVGLSYLLDFEFRI